MVVFDVYLFINTLLMHDVDALSGNMHRGNKVRLKNSGPGFQYGGDMGIRVSY